MTETEDRKKPVPEKNIRTSETFRYPDRKNRKIRNVQNIRTGRSETSEPF